MASALGSSDRWSQLDLVETEAEQSARALFLHSKGVRIRKVLLLANDGNNANMSRFADAVGKGVKRK